MILNELARVSTALGDWLVRHPIVLLAALLIPLLLAARFKHAYPSRRLLGLAAVPTLLTFGTVFNRQIGWTILGLDGALAVLAILDLWWLLPQRYFSASRKMLRVASLDKPHQVEISVTNSGRTSVNAKVADDVPEGFEIEGKDREFFCRLGAKTVASIRYALRPFERGRFWMHQVYLKISSPLGLWKGVYRVAAESEIHVYPDLKQIAEYSLLARTNRLSQFGVRRTRRVGQDNDFERLRDYNLDDNFKFIDWRTTARRRKLTVKDFQSSQSQRIIFLVDCGRMMTNEHSGLNLLDHALNAALMLSHVALMRGDAVGMLFFNNRVLSYVPPKSGKGQMNHLLHAAFDRHPEYVESRYDQAFVYLRTRCLKRSLIVLMTSVIDEVNANQVQRYLGALVGRHLPVGVLMRDSRIWRMLEAYESDTTELFTAAAAADILAWRHEVLVELDRSGVLYVDAFPNELSAPLINRYLEIKARHLL